MPTGATAITIADVNSTTANLSGYAWGSTLGWINMSPSGSGVTVNISSGVMSGYAWSGVSGYINFAPTGYGVTINASGELNGHAWSGGPSGGWIKFACPGSNGDTCVKTDWRPTAGRSVVSSGGGGGGGGGGGSFVVQPTTTGSSTQNSISTGPTTQSGPQNQKNGDFTNLYRADINDSNLVDIFDYNSIMVNWNKVTTISQNIPKIDRCKASNAADVNCDGRIDLLDFNIIMIYWGQKVRQSGS